MNQQERLARIRQVERKVAKLVAKGWRMERIDHTDEDGEPFRTTIQVCCDGTDEKAGTI